MDEAVTWAGAPVPTGVGDVPMDAHTADRATAPLATIRLFIAIDAMFSQLRRKLELGPNERLAIEYLWEYGPMAMSELADRLAVTRAAVTTLVDRLEEMDYVARHGDVRDRRRTIVCVSKNGMQRCCDAVSEWMGGTQAVFADLDDAEFKRVGWVMNELHRITGTQSDVLRGIERPRTP